MSMLHALSVLFFCFLILISLHFSSFIPALYLFFFFFFFQAEDGIRDTSVTGVQTCALPICVDLLVDVRERPVPVHGGQRGPGVGAEEVDRLGDEAGRRLRVARQRRFVGRRSEERRVGKEGRSRWATDG